MPHSTGGTMGLALVLLVGSCGAPEDGPACGAADLQPPTRPCNHFNNDSTFQGICAVDCEGNVFPSRQGTISELPDGRFFGIVFSPLPGSVTQLDPARVEAFAGKNNLCNPADPLPERHSGNALPASAEFTASGDLFVRIGRRLNGPIQLAVNLGMGPNQYGWRSYVGGEPYPLFTCAGPWSLF